ncbi:helix-turn-helix domain-containing protein, partial [Tahibacter sp.]|uniref:helix-turn-helix domain-containing protein n=1 Tax=Tahibacter sp. TaxID=2056211 RepID=UPI0028C49FE0
MKFMKDDMSVARVIKSGDDYESALNELERLIGEDPPIDSVPGDRLELLTVLVREYESRQFAFEPADAVDAIEFRMEEQGLRQKDLAPLLGGKNRVSEVLSRKRTLTLDMIRALHSGLGIPLRVLIEPQRERSASDAMERQSEDRFDWIRWNEFPVAEMQRRGWFDDLALGKRQDPEQLVRSFLGKVVDRVDSFPALFRRSFRGQGITAQTRYALVAWTSQILIKAKGRENDAPAFSPHGLNDKVFRELAQLSQFPDGPKRVEAALLGLGIILIVEPGLPTMLADGAVMMSASGRAVVGLTLRFDRIDSFWFTLFHELAHARYHLNGLSEA